MQYPLISEYRESILSAEDNFNELASLRPVLDGHGDPVMSSGNFAVVFKMKDENDGKLYAVKCFIKDQEGRDESYRKIADELEVISSSYFLPLRYLENELFVDSAQCEQEEFPVVVMEWVEGETLDAYLNRNLNDKYELEMLSYRFNRMAAWLLSQPFAHGDLKPDNILVRNDGSLVLVDYDGMYVPSMKGEKAREIGSPDYRHPSRTESDFNEHIDDFSIATIALSLKAIALNPDLKTKPNASDTLLLSEDDYQDPGSSDSLKELQTLMGDSELSLLFGAYSIALAKNSLDLVSFRLFMTQKPVKPTISEIQHTENFSTEVTEKDIEEGIADEHGVIYSKDGKRLLKCKSKLKEYNIKQGTQIISNNAFKNCSSLKGLNIPDSVSYIGDYAFFDCSSLLNVNIPNSVKFIGEYAFYGCKSLQNVTIPDSVTSIGNNAFSRCDSLQDVTIPESVNSIGCGVFSHCSSLKSVVIPHSVIAIGYDAFFDCWSLKSVTIPDSVTSIGDSAFCMCSSLKNVIIPDSVIYLGNCAFCMCSSLQSVTIPDSVTSIGIKVFSECKSLKDVTISKSVTSIGCSAFSKCKSLQNLNIPDSVTSINSTAFAGCESLHNVTIPNSVTTLGNNPFRECLNINLVLSLKSNFKLLNNLLIDIKGRLICCFDKSSIVKIPDSVTSIGEDAFYGCGLLQSVTIPDSVTSIGWSAFLKCESLQNVTIPNSVTSIGCSAFYKCKSLQSVTIPNSVTSIQASTFVSCKSLLSVTIPESVTSIENSAFSSCESLLSVTIPKSVTSIGNWAFDKCDSLKIVILPKSVTSIGIGAFPSSCKVIRK